MPKTKTNSSAKKRLKVTGGGKIMHRHAFSSHLFEGKTSKRRRSFRKDYEVAPADQKLARKLLDR